MNIIGIALYRFFDLLIGVILVRCILTWFPGGYNSKLYYYLSRVTDPIEEPIRNIMYRYSSGPIDFTPMIAILLLNLLRSISVGIFM